MPATTAAAPDTPDVRTRRLAELRAALPEHLERLTWSADQLARHQRDRLRALLRVATDQSPFHAERLRDIDPDRFELDDLPSLPVMTKGELMARFDDVVTDRTVTRQAAEAHLASTGVDADELDGRYVVLASGGSSGERGVFVAPRAAAADCLLAAIRPGIARIIALLGELPPDPPPIAVVSAGSAVHATRAFASLFGGDLMDVHSIPATDPLPSIVERLNDLQPLLLQGYPSAIRHLADERRAGRLQISPLSVTTTSEPLVAEVRASIDDAFRVGVCDMFGSSEGLFGVSPPDDPGIVLATDLALVELVDGDGAPVPPGTPSDRVLVTNLTNTVQPLIRYELTDSFVELPTPSPATDGFPRVRVDGRRDDELQYGDVVVHPLAVRSELVKVPEVVEYQVRQTEHGVDVAVVTSAAVAVDELAGRLRAALTHAGLPDPAVVVREVPDTAIERHPETGKTKRFLTLA
jgi:phenylacetate-CoA ligase